MIGLDRRYKELVFYKAYTELLREASRTYIGFLWWILDPIIHMMVFYVVFATIRKNPTEGFVYFLLVGLTVWKWFQTTLMHAAKSIHVNRGLMDYVYLPKALFPTIVIISDLFKFTLIFLCLLVFLWCSGHGINIQYLALPVVLLVEFMFIIGLSFMLAAIIPFLPDLEIIVGNALLFLFFFSGIFFDGTKIEPIYPTQFYFFMNPMACLLTAFRDILLYDQWPAWRSLVFIGLSGCVFVYLGRFLISKFDKEYPRLVQ